MSLDNVLRFVDNKQFISATDYERELGHVYSEYKESQWIERFVALFLMAEKFENDFFMDHAKEVLKSNREFPVNINNTEQLENIIELLIPYKDRYPKLFLYAVPIHISSMYVLYKMNGTKEIFDDYLEKIYIERPVEDILDDMVGLRVLPKKIGGIISFKSEEDYEVNINNNELNSIFYRFKLDKVDYRLNFLPKMTLHSSKERRAIDEYNKSENKGFLYKPEEKSIDGKMIPVMLEVNAGIFWISADMKDENKVSIPLDFNLMEVLEGVATMDPLTIFKMINRDDNFKDAEEIIQILISKKNKTLSSILRDYYIEKYKDNNHVNVDGYAIYRGFIDSPESTIEFRELDRFNSLVQEENLNVDKAKFIIFFERMRGEIPLLAKPIIGVRKIAEKIKNKIVSDED